MSTHHHEHGDCKELLELLSDYLDGELDPGACAEVDAHMDECDRCREFVESLRRTVALIQRAFGRPLPDDVRRDVLDAYSRLRSET